MITAIKAKPPTVTPQIRPSLVVFVGLICGVTVAGVVLIAVIINIFCRS
jgi:hypothetical protein